MQETLTRVSRRELARVARCSEAHVRKLLRNGTLLPALLSDGRLDLDKGETLLRLHKARALRLESRPTHRSGPMVSAAHITKFLRDNLARSDERYTEDVSFPPWTLEECETEGGYTRADVLRWCRAGMQHAAGNPITGEGLLIQPDALFLFGATVYVACGIEGDEELYGNFRTGDE